MLLDLIHSFSHSQSQFLEQKSLLTKLSLINCNLTVFSCGRLGEAIGPNRFLSTVVLDSNKFGTAGAVALCVGLGESDASLHTFSISNSFVNSSIPFIFLSALRLLFHVCCLASHAELH
jgi:hypothetical protein